LQEVGAARSIVIDEDGNILAGNATIEAAAEAGIENLQIVDVDGETIVAVRRTGLTEEAKKRLAYFDNRTAELADWDADVILADLEAGVDFDGLFTELELEDFGWEPDVAEDAGAQMDKADELQEKWQVERGQVWQVGKHRVMCGDSTDADDVEKLMGGEKALLVVTDPPYGVNYSGKNTFLNAADKGNCVQSSIEGDAESGEAVQRIWKASFCEMNTIMERGASVYCFMPQGGDQMMMMMMMMMEAGIEPRHELIWLKNNHVLGRVDYAYKHEPILYAWKDGGHKFYGGFQTSILEFPKPLKSDLHPTTKPTELIERLIANSSKPGEIIYDPFLGSGTTCVAAEQTGRVCFGADICEKYCAVTLQRLQDMGLAPRLVSDDA